MKESDLYVLLEKYYTDLGYEVKGEVCGCDLVAVKGDDLVIIELKKSFNVKLLYQAVRRLTATDNVYVAFLKPETRQPMSYWTMIKSLCRRLHIGAFVIDKGSIKCLSQPAPFLPKKSSVQAKKIFAEFSGRKASVNVGGVTGKKLETAYLENAIKIAVILSDNEARSAKQLAELGASEKAHSILYKNHYGWFEKKEKGIYRLKKGAPAEIRERYPKIWFYYAREIEGGH